MRRRRNRIRTCRGASLRLLAQFLQSVENEVEPELERAHLAVRAVGQVLVAMLCEVRVVVEREVADEPLDDFGRDRGMAREPEREAEDVRVERVVGGVGRIRGEARLAEAPEELVHVDEPGRTYSS